MVRDPNVTVDDMIDAIEGNRKYIRCLYVINKIDTISMEEVDEIARMFIFIKSKARSCCYFLLNETQLPISFRKNLGKTCLGQSLYQKKRKYARF